MKWKAVVLGGFALFAVVGAAQAAGILDQSGSGGAIDEREQLIAQKLEKRLVATDALARRGPRGLRGPRGPKGPKGLQGAPGLLSSAVPYSSPTVPICGWEAGACSVQSAIAVCPPGTIVIGGGHSGAGIRVFISQPVPGGWAIGATNESSFASSFKATVMCGS